MSVYPWWRKVLNLSISQAPSSFNVSGVCFLEKNNLFQAMRLFPFLVSTEENSGFPERKPSVGSITHLYGSVGTS